LFLATQDRSVFLFKTLLVATERERGNKRKKKKNEEKYMKMKNDFIETNPDQIFAAVYPAGCHCKIIPTRIHVRKY